MSRNRFLFLLVSLPLCAPVAQCDLAHTADYSGNVGVEIAALPFGGTVVPTGTFDVTGIPAGAVVRSAFVRCNDWFTSGGNLTLDFDGGTVGMTPPFANESMPAGDLFDYRWDVTGLVPGNGSYDFVVNGGNQVFVVALTVVYEHPSLPATTLRLYEGAAQVGAGNMADTRSFALAGTVAGPATVHLLTEADNGGLGQTDEVISYNGAVVGGPIDANLGDYASLFTLPVTNLGGPEDLRLETLGDWFGVHQVIVAEEVPTGTPLCFGDGSGLACPCGNTGGTGAGCANGAGVGALLTASGDASVTADSMSLTCEGVINDSGLFFQGDDSINGGAGAVFGDGLRCCGTSVVRLQVVNPPGTASPTTAQMTELATDNGPAGTIQPGDDKCYQYWYRDPSSSPCGGQFNLSNALLVTWQA